MSIELATKYLPYVDEVFSAESRKSLLTNQDFSWTGAHTVKIYSVTTAPMNDYDREGTGDTWSRYGALTALDATTQEMTLRRDRSFTFAIDALDEDETARALSAKTALERQIREQVVPEIDSWVYAQMVQDAGTVIDGVPLTADNIIDEIYTATESLDNFEVPEIVRFIVVTPSTFKMMKKAATADLVVDIDADLAKRGVIAMFDSNIVVRVPSVRLPDDFGFMICHPSATVAPTKLESFRIHSNPPGISGGLVEGRVCYDAFVLNNKKSAIYYHKA